MSTPAKTSPTLASYRSPNKMIAIDIASTPNSSPIKENVTGGGNINTGPAITISSGSPLLKGYKPTSSTADTTHPPPSFEIDDDSTSKPATTWTERYLTRPFQTKIVTPMINILKSGATPEGIALSLAFGLTGGVFPVPATTTVMCVIFVFIFKLNLAAVQLTNLLMTPVNLATFMTFIRYGESLFGAQPVELSIDLFQADPLGALATFWISLCYGIVAWAIFTPPATFICYSILKPILRKAMASMFQKPD